MYCVCKLNALSYLTNSSRFLIFDSHMHVFKKKLNEPQEYRETYNVSSEPCFSRGVHPYNQLKIQNYKRYTNKSLNKNS